MIGRVAHIILLATCGLLPSASGLFSSRNRQLLPSSRVLFPFILLSHSAASAETAVAWPSEPSPRRRTGVLGLRGETEGRKFCSSGFVLLAFLAFLSSAVSQPTDFAFHWSDFISPSSPRHQKHSLLQIRSRAQQAESRLSRVKSLDSRLALSQSQSQSRSESLSVSVSIHFGSSDTSVVVSP